ARLEKLRDDMVERQKKLTELEKRWKAEKGALQDVGELKERLNEARIALDRAMREGDYQEASKLNYEVIPKIEKSLDEAEHLEVQGERMVNDQVTDRS